MWFDQRQRESELMDQLDLQPSLLHAALQGLDRLHWWSRTASLLWQPIARLARLPGAVPLRVLDIGCGSGELLVQLGRRARSLGIDVSLTGCDLNPSTMTYARRHARAAGIAARFFTFDVRSHETLPDYDVVLTSTFLHHLDNAQALALLARMCRSARRLVMVDDLIRGWSGWMLAQLGTRLLLTSRVNRIDAARSVAAAFSIEEVRRLACDAGLAGATIERRWPSRFLLCWLRNTASAVTRETRAAVEMMCD